MCLRILSRALDLILLEADECRTPGAVHQTLSWNVPTLSDALLEDRVYNRGGGSDAVTKILYPKAIPPFAALRAFEAVGRCGGIRKAALALKLDHAVVSRHVHLLEKWLGVVLIQRINGEMRLSSIGSQYHARISAALVDLASATTDLLETESQRRLKVWCVPGLANQWLADRLAEFSEAWPEYEIELRPSDNAPDLLMYEADMDIRFYGDNWAAESGRPGLKFIELVRPKLMAVTSPGLAKRFENIAGPATFSRRRCFTKRMMSNGARG